MSKKSRRRNKALLAIAGLAGAAALANRKPKQSSTEEDSGNRGDGPAAIARRNANKDTATKDTATKTSTTIQDNKNKDRTKSMAETSTVPKKRPGITVYDDGSIKAKDKGSGNQVDYANKEKYSTRTDTKAPGASDETKKTFSFINPSKSSFAQNQAKKGLRSGGRAGYKHGGSTGSSKSSGAAKRGISPILMKGRK
jgi:hypothetical protein